MWKAFQCYGVMMVSMTKTDHKATEKSEIQGQILPTSTLAAAVYQIMGSA